jgi:hypothetical protein
VTVTAAPGVLTAGTYTGNIAVTVGSQIQNIPVTLTVSADPVLVSSPGAFIFSYVSGNPAPAVQYLSVNVTTFRNRSLPYRPRRHPGYRSLIPALA